MKKSVLPTLSLGVPGFSPRTNIMFMLIDELGWRDLACYGSRFYETPNLDRLARGGMRFADHTGVFILYA